MLSAARAGSIPSQGMSGQLQSRYRVLPRGGRHDAGIHELRRRQEWDYSIRTEAEKYSGETF